MNKILLVQGGKSRSYEGREREGHYGQAPGPRPCKHQLLQWVAHNLRLQERTQTNILLLDNVPDSSQGIYTLHVEMHQPQTTAQTTLHCVRLQGATFPGRKCKQPASTCLHCWDRDAGGLTPTVHATQLPAGLASTSSPEMGRESTCQPGGHATCSLRPGQGWG